VGVSLVASTFAAVAVVALHGLLVLFVPSGRLASLSAVVRSALILLLVMALPLIGRLPGAARDVAAGEPWIVWTPPLWFVAIERQLAGGTQVLNWPTELNVLGLNADWRQRMLTCTNLDIR
jgi:hypothetical protein